MVSYHELVRTFRAVGLRRDVPVIVHTGRLFAGKVNGGISTFMGALLSAVDNVLFPAFTYSTMIIPQQGPADNDIEYGSGDTQNAHAAIFSHTLPSECGNNEAIDILKGFPGVLRSSHPIFSFYGLGLDVALLDQTTDDPYFPIRKIESLGGWVVLADAEPGDNFSIHYAEMLAGRKQYLRWALTDEGAAACPHFPGCPAGFHKLEYYLHDELHKHSIKQLTLSAVPLSTLINTTVALLKEDPFALLCNDLQCVRCNLVRDAVKAKIASRWKAE